MTDDLVIPASPTSPLLDAIAGYHRKCERKGYPPAFVPMPAPVSAPHAHALPPATRDRQLARQAVTQAHDALERAEHAERLAGDVVRRAMAELTAARERLADAEREIGA